MRCSEKRLEELLEKSYNIHYVFDGQRNYAADQRHNDVLAETLFFIGSLLCECRDLLLIILGVLIANTLF